MNHRSTLFALAIGFGILIAMLLSSLLSRPATAKVAGYVCGIILLDHSAAPWSDAFFRMIETALGIGMAMAVSVVPKLLRTEQKGE